MPLAVLPALVPDITPAYDVFFLAFAHEPIMPFLYPRGIDRKAHHDGTIQYWHVDKTGYTAKCVDTETGEIIGMSTWDIMWNPDEGQRWTKPGGIPWLEGEEEKRCLEVVEPMWDLRERLFGKRKYIYLSSIAVHPDHQRRGAGSLLLQWGMDIANQMGIPVYTEASETGYALYEDMGWERLTRERLVHKKEVLGGEKDVEIPLMAFMPTAAKGMGFEEWVEKGYPDF